MLIEQYPIGWAVDAGNPEPVMAYLIDLPGIAMQGPTLQDAIDKLKIFAPTVLAQYRSEGATLPAPSAEPNLLIGALEMQWFTPVPATQPDPAAIALGAEIELATASGKTPTPRISRPRRR